MPPRASAEPSEVVRIELPESLLGRCVAELWSLGTLGVEERTGPGERVIVLAYFRAGHEVDLGGLRALGSDLSVAAPERVEARDWDAEWRRGLRPRRIGPVWIRPSWCASQGTPELVIDPQQAFGSGEHATTRLALELLADELLPGDRVLDVGSGSGILGLAALRLGAGAALGVELDPVACANAAHNARRNALPLALVCSTQAALAPGARFDLVVANMLLGELLGCLPALLARARRCVVLSGYLEAEAERLEAAAQRAGWVTAHERAESQSGDRWCGRVLAQDRDRQSSSTSFKVSSKV